jgi:hypothetical protein
VVEGGHVALAILRLDLVGPSVQKILGFYFILKTCLD